VERLEQQMASKDAQISRMKEDLARGPFLTKPPFRWGGGAEGRGPELGLHRNMGAQEDPHDSHFGSEGVGGSTPFFQCRTFNNQGMGVPASCGQKGCWL